MKRSTHPDCSSPRRRLGPSRLSRTDVCFLLLAALAIGWKLLLCGAQHADIQVAATLDDKLMFDAARSFAAGNWFGPFSWDTLGKHMFFSIWLGTLMRFGIPYLMAGQLLWLSAVLLAVWALAPMFRKSWQKFSLFLLLWMLPYSTAAHTLRVYRDNIFPALCLLCFAGVAGAALRAAGGRGGWGFGLLAGVGLGLSWLTREDGVWLLPFVVCGFAAGLLCAAWQKGGAKLLLRALAAPVLCAAASLCIIGAYCLKNQQFYGVFLISDFTGGSFPEAVGAFLRCDGHAHAGVLVCSETRQRIYEVSPLAARLGEALDSGDYYGAYGYGAEAAEFKSGGLCWAMKKAAFDANLFYNAENEQEFWKELADEVNAAVEAGLLEDARGETASTLVPFHSSFLPEVLAEFGRSVRVLVGFEQCHAQTAFNNVPPEEAARWESLLNCKSGFSLLYQSEPQYLLYTPYQKLSLFGFSVNTWVFRILILPALTLALVRMVRQLAAGLRRGGDRLQLACGVLALGFLLSLILRTGIAAYMEAVSFRIGTYLLYLSPGGPLVGLLMAYGLAELPRAVCALRSRFAGGKTDET